MSETGNLPAGTTLYHCPLCEWTLPDLPIHVELWTEQGALEVMKHRAGAIERDVKGHLSSHSLLDWTQEVQRLRELAERPRQLVGQWRDAADSLRSTNAAWSSHFYDCANELERLLTP